MIFYIFSQAYLYFFTKYYLLLYSIYLDKLFIQTQESPHYHVWVVSYTKWKNIEHRQPDGLPSKLEITLASWPCVEKRQRTYVSETDRQVLRQNNITLFVRLQISVLVPIFWWDFKNVSSQKARQVKSNVKMIMTTFFFIHPRDRTVAIRHTNKTWKTRLKNASKSEING